MLLQLFVLVLLDSEVGHKLVDLSLSVTFLADLVQSVALSVLNSLQKLYLFLELFVFFRQLDELVLEIGDSAVAFD